MQGIIPHMKHWQPKLCVCFTFTFTATTCLLHSMLSSFPTTHCHRDRTGDAVQRHYRRKGSRKGIHPPTHTHP